MCRNHIHLRSVLGLLQRNKRAIYVPLFMLTFSILGTVSFSDVESTIKLNDIEIQIFPYTKEGTITAGEPLIAKVDIINKSEKEQKLVLGNNVHPYTYMEVLDQNGKTVASTPKPENIVDGISMLYALKPGESFTRHLVVSALYKFKSPGMYTIRIQQMEPNEGLSVMAEGTATVNVLPHSSSRLEARCNEISRAMRGLDKTKEKLPISAYTKALYSVDDEAGLPSLEWMVREWDNKHACLVMRRIGTQRANDVLSSLATREDGPGKAARSAMKWSLEATDIMWEINYY